VTDTSGQAKRTVLSGTVRNFRATTRRTFPPWTRASLPDR
jgi:hypothetical protein